jgi:hypothetical protein
MHHGESVVYQFAAASSREIMMDFVRIASSPPAEAVAAS